MTSSGSDAAAGTASSSSSASRRWYVAAAQPGREDVALSHLSRQGFVSWLPRQRRMVRHARRVVEKRVAFFPGYLFVSLDLSTDRWRPINGTIGVRSLLMQGSRPQACPVGLVESLRAMADADGLVDERSALVEGEAVRIRVGPFADMVGTLAAIERAGRARVLIDILNGTVAVRMGVTNLSPFV